MLHKHRLFILPLICAALTASSCKTSGGGGGGGEPAVGGNSAVGPDDGAPSGQAVSAPAPSGNNVLSLTVDGSNCGTQPYINQPCVTATICVHGTSNCQTINNLLLDTGSSGLRVFASLVTLSLPQLQAKGGGLAECVSFADNSSEWGPVVTADVKLAGEPAVAVPIQLINSAYSNPPGACSAQQSTPDTDPGTAGFNGILGVGLFNQDCDACTTVANNNSYYACSGSQCTNIASSVQVQNPVALLPTDNNGVILTLPSVGYGGVPVANGSVILGIGTQANNSPTGLTTYTTDQYGFFTTQFSPFSQTAITSFIDSGSNELAVPKLASLPLCEANAGALCPSAPLDFSATNIAAGGSPSGIVTFQVASQATLGNSNNAVFSNIASQGATDTTGYFDWGLPFFFGRTVVVGIEGKSSPLGKGKYWAY